MCNIPVDECTISQTWKISENQNVVESQPSSLLNQTHFRLIFRAFFVATIQAAWNGIRC